MMNTLYKLTVSISKKSAWMIAVFFLIAGPLCIYRAYALYSTAWIQESFLAILKDPIYQYAVLDLGMFCILFLWAMYQDCKKKNKAFWYWPILIFIFGSPIIAVYIVLNLSQKQSAESQKA